MANKQFTRFGKEWKKEMMQNKKQDIVNMYALTGRRAIEQLQYKSDSQMRDILSEIVTERKRQDEKFGPDRDHHPLEWLPILAEEHGEVNQAALETYFNNKSDYSEYRKELIQVAAVAVAMIEGLDRNPHPYSHQELRTILPNLNHY